jgi:integrase
MAKAPRSRKIPWLAERNGVYYVMWYDDATRATKRQSLRTSAAIEAQARYAAFLAEGGDRIQDPAGKLTVKGALNDYRREHLPLVAAPRRAENAITHLISFFGNTPLSDIDIPASRAYAAWRRANLRMGAEGGRVGASDGTLRRELVVLRAAANHARRWKRLTEMPSIELPRETPQTGTWLTKAEVERAISTAEGMLRDFILIAYYTGARRASVEGLTRRQIDLRHGTINLTSPHETQAQRRSNKRRPVVPIHTRIRPVIETMLMSGTSEYLFGRKIDIYQRFHNHMCALGYTDRAHPHILRHSRATHLLQDGVNIYDVARLLGDSVGTVEKTYGHHSPADLAASIGER